MKLTFITPTTKNSAIAISTLQVVRSMSRAGHSVNVISSERMEPDEANQLDFGVQMTHWCQQLEVESAVLGAICVYEIGDNHELHAGSLELLQKYPGVVVLHDAYIGHLFSAWAHQSVEKLFHFQATHRLNESPAEPVPSNFRGEIMGTEYRYLSLVLDYATSTITHSPWSAKYAEMCTDLQVDVLPLPWPALDSFQIPQETKGGTFTVLTFGNVNQNKRCESVIDAISKLENAAIGYRIVGQVDRSAAKKLTDTASRLGVNLQVLGEVNKATLRRELEQADLIVNLRNPTLEGASASLLDAFSVRKAVVVSNAGHYADLPDDLVFKINPLDEIEELQEVIGFAFENPGLLAAMGSRAQSYFERVHKVEHYALSLAKICEASTASIPMILERQRTRIQLSKTLFELMREGRTTSLQSRTRARVVALVRFGAIPLIRVLASNDRIVRIVKFVYKWAPVLERAINRLIYFSR